MRASSALPIVLLVSMILPAAATWCWFVQFAGHPVARAVYGAAKVIQFLIPVGWVVLAERRGWKAAGGADRAGGVAGSSSTEHLSGGDGWIFLRRRGRHVGDPDRRRVERAGFARTSRDASPSRRSSRERRLAPMTGILLGLVFGALVGGCILVLYFGVLKASPLLAGTASEVRTKLEQLGLGTVAGYLALSLFYSLAHSLLEEYYWRWFVFGQLRNLVRLPLAIVLSSLAFMAHHVIVVGVYLPRAWGLAILVSLAVAAGGAAWAWLYERTGSPLGPWASHLIVDAAIMIVGYDMIWGLFA